MAIPSVTLNNGVTCPILGLGTLGRTFDDNETIQTAIEGAIAAGIRHFDTASFYQNEDRVGAALNESIAKGHVKREELFVTTKLWINCFRKEKVLPALRESLARLKLNYVDLYLIHWPMPMKGENVFGPDASFDDEVDIYTETWPELEKAVELGLTKSIGISNFNSQQVNQLMKVAKIKPVVNQVESHPLLSQRKLIDHCAQYGIKIVAYSALGGTPAANEQVAKSLTRVNWGVRPQLFDEPLVKQLSSKYGKTEAQILIKFQVQRGVIVIPKSRTPSRIQENANIFDFELTTDELSQLEGLNKNLRFLHIDSWKDHKNYPFTIEY